MPNPDSLTLHGTTIVCVRKNGKVAIGGDGQVTLGHTVVKSSAKKVRKLAGGSIIAGFAGATADAFTLLERFEKRLESHNRQLMRAAQELARDWRTDRVLRKLEAMLLLADAKETILLSGLGDVLVPEFGVIAIGSGAPYAESAALALLRHGKDLPASTIVEESLKIAAHICIYTNDQISIEQIDSHE